MPAAGYALANRGMDTRSLQAYLGHVSITHTVRYTEMSPTRFTRGSGIRCSRSPTMRLFLYSVSSKADIEKAAKKARLGPIAGIIRFTGIFSYTGLLKYSSSFEYNRNYHQSIRRFITDVELPLRIIKNKDARLPSNSIRP